jgi:hypothetical protein
VNSARFIVIGFLLVVMAGVIVLLTAPRAKPQVWTLPDGSTLKLVKVTWGTNHVCRYGNRVIDYLYPVIPVRFRTNFTFQVATNRAPVPGGMVVWFRRSGLASNAVAQPGPPFTSVGGTLSGLSSSMAQQMRVPARYSLSVVDDYAVESLSISPVKKGVISSASELDSCLVQTYPRRAKSVGLRLYWTAPVLNGATSNPVPSLLAEFQVPNPAPAILPSWPVESLPATRRTNGLEVSLTALETGLTMDEISQRRLAARGFRGSTGPSREPQRRYAYATFAVRENGRETTNWGPSWLVLSNVFGEARTVPFSPLAPRGLEPMSISPGLWVEEPAWKLVLDLSRVADFPPAELWTVRGLAVSGAGQPIGPSFTTNLIGVEVSFNIVGGGSGRGFSMLADPVGPSQRYVSTGSAVQLSLSVQAPNSVRVFILELKDDQGRNWRSGGGSSSGTGPRGGSAPRLTQQTFRYSVPPETKTFDVTLAVTAKLPFEFCVKPTLAGTNAVSVK